MNFEYSHYLSIMSNRMPFLGMSGCMGWNCVSTPFIPAKAEIQDQPISRLQFAALGPRVRGDERGTRECVSFSAAS
jgi:hypothetical protein